LIQDHRQVMILELQSLASSTAVVTWRLDLHRRQDLDDRGRHLTVFRDDGLDRPDDLDHRRHRKIDQLASVIATINTGQGLDLLGAHERPSRDQSPHLVGQDRRTRARNDSVASGSEVVRSIPSDC
jgi:hypothetical protein